MQKFIISAENTCDLPQETLAELNIKIINLHYFVDGEEYPCENFNPSEFYNKLRGGARSSTSQPGFAEFTDFFSEALEKGADILHLSFSSVLSGTYANAVSAAKELQASYPDRKIYVIDTKSQSAGQGLLVYLVAKKAQEGADIEACRDYALSMIQRINHVFTINDLRSLARTGRVSDAEAFIGNLLQIKPLMYTDEAGRLTPYQKTISRKLSLNALCDKVKSLYDGDCKSIFLTHSDCIKDAEYVAERLRAIPGVEEVRIFPLNPVIGCHTGAETIAIFFTAASRTINAKK